MVITRTFGRNREDINMRQPAIPTSKNLSVKPAERPSDRLIPLIFFPATAFKTSPALRAGLKFPAKSPIVFTT